MVKKKVVKKEKSKNKIKCFYCKNNLDLSSEKYILLGTYDKNKPIDESWFHKKCFNDWHDQKVNEKARKIMSDMQNKVKDFLPTLQNLIGNFKGINNLQDIFNMNLDKKKNGKTTKSKV